MSDIDPMEVPARPTCFALGREHTAVLVIDMQNDFGSPGGMFDRAGIDITPIRATLEPTALVLAAARAADWPVIYLTMQHRPDLADMGGPDAPHRIKHAALSVGKSVDVPAAGGETRILVSGHWGTEVVPELAPHPGDLLVPKHRYSGFFETPLDTILQGLGVQDLIVTGCTTSVCVDSTVRDAMFRNYRCLVLEDCTAEPIGAGNSRTNHESTLLTLELLFGWVSDSRKLTAALRGQGLDSTGQ